MTKFLAVFVLAVIGVLSTTRDAAAIPVIYQTGKEAFECGPLPEPFDKEPELQGFKAGYVCDITGVFWTYFSVRNCQAAAITGNQYNDDAKLVEAIKAKYPESSMKRGLWNRYGWILFALGILGGIIIWIKEKVTGED
jgi:hypothetical protein